MPTLAQLLLLACCCCAATPGALGQPQPPQPGPRPPHTEHARLARWLALWIDWGTLSTLGGAASAPGAGVVSFAAGPTGSVLAGRLFFYLTPMDETGQHIQDHPECALSVSEAQMHPSGCGSTDPMDPTCARITVLGRMLPIEAADQQAATAVMFARHPAAATWPADHGFRMYELHIREVHMLDFYGGMHVLSPDQWFAADPGPSALLAHGPATQQAAGGWWLSRRGGQHSDARVVLQRR